MYTETNQANKYGPVPAGRQRNSLEHGSSIFRPEIVQTFSDDFRPVPVETHRKLTGSHQKKSGQFPAGILLPVPWNSSVFLQNPVTGIFDLGSLTIMKI